MGAENEEKKVATRRDVEAQQETKKTRRKRDVEGQEIETTEEDRNAGQEVTKDQAKRWYGYGYGGYGLGYGGFYRPYGYGYWGKRDVETQSTRSKRDVEGQEVTKDQAKRWFGVGMGYHPYAYSPYGYGYWGKRDVEAQQETKKTRRKRDVEGQEIETTEEDRNAGQEVTKDQAKRWYGYGYGGYGLGYGGFYRPYGYGYWGKKRHV